MPYIARCNGCGASAVLQDATDPDSQVKCAPGSGCCQEDHHHGQAANACPEISKPLGQRHGGAACPHPSENGVACTAVTPHGKPCPGGHCHKDIEGCTVCRPITLDFLGGAVTPV